MKRPNATLLLALSTLCLAVASTSTAAQSLPTQPGDEPAAVGQADAQEQARPEGDAEIEVAIPSGASDAEEFLEGSADDPERWPPGYTYTGSSDLELAYDTIHGPQVVGLHFGSLGIPAGARVTSAVVRFTANLAQDGPVELSIGAQNDPAAGRFVEDADASPSYGITSRPLLSRQLTWSPAPVAVEETFETPELAPLLQQLVDHERWNEESSLVLRIEAVSIESSNYRSAYSHDGSAERAPRLLVRYQPAGGEPGAEAAEPELTQPSPEMAEPQADVGEGEPARAEPAQEMAEPDEGMAEPQAEPAEPQAAGREPAQEAAADGADPAEAGQDGPQRARYALGATHDAGVSGSVLISDYGLGGTILSVSLDDPQPDVTYRASLHGGPCASVQNELLMLQSIDGRQGLSATILDLPFEELAGGDFHVNVFRIGERTRLAACAQLNP